MGLETHLLSPKECHEKWPLMKYDDLQVLICGYDDGHYDDAHNTGRLMDS